MELFTVRHRIARSSASPETSAPRRPRTARLPAHTPSAPRPPGRAAPAYVPPTPSTADRRQLFPPATPPATPNRPPRHALPLPPRRGRPARRWWAPAGPALHRAAPHLSSRCPNRVRHAHAPTESLLP